MSRHSANRVVLARYERSSTGVYYLDVTANSVTDLYSSYDKSAPFVRRDLDLDLVAYLIDCCRELKSVPFEIRLTFAEPPDEQRVARVKNSIAAYFAYLSEKEREEMRHRYRRSVALVLVGIGILFASVGLKRLLLPNGSVVSSVLSEGLAILAWVAIWEASALFLLEWLPFRRRMALYSRLEGARLLLRDDALLDVSTPPGRPGAGRSSEGDRPVNRR